MWKKLQKPIEDQGFGGSQGRPGASWGRLGLSWARLGGALSRLGGRLGCVLGQLGGLLGRLKRVLERLGVAWRVLDASSPKLGPGMGWGPNQGGVARSLVFEPSGLFRAHRRAKRFVESVARRRESLYHRNLLSEKKGPSHAKRGLRGNVADQLCG